MLTAKEAAEKLNGVSYNNKNQMIRAMLIELKLQRLTVVYGDSDDLLEMQGSIDAEYGAYGGTTAKLCKDFIPVSNKCHDDTCPYFLYDYEEAPWYIKISDSDGEPGEADRIIETNIPDVEWFDIMEDGKVYCKGFVFKR